MELTTVYTIPLDARGDDRSIDHIAVDGCGDIHITMRRTVIQSIHVGFTVFFAHDGVVVISPEKMIKRLDTAEKNRRVGITENTCIDTDGGMLFFDERMKAVKKRTKNGKVRIIAVIDATNVHGICVMKDTIYAVDRFNDKVFKIHNGVVSVFDVDTPTSVGYWLGGLCMTINNGVCCGEEFTLVTEVGEELGKERLIRGLEHMASYGDALYVANRYTAVLERLHQGPVLGPCQVWMRPAFTAVGCNVHTV